MEKHNKLVSVIVPVYNREKELERALNSIFNQTYPFYEVIVIDDGSKLNLKKIITKFDQNKIVYLKNQENRGVSFSRNRGIKESNGDLIAFLDSDDEWKKDKLEKQINYMKETGYRVVHTEEIWIRNGVRVNPKKRHKKNGGDIFIPSLELCLMSPSSIILKREIFDIYGLFDENLAVCEDYDLWLRITSKENVGFIEEPLIIKYGGHKDQLSRKYEAMDRFRVQSLLNLLINCELTDYQKEEVKKMIEKKTKILYNGAIKRGKKDAIIYQKWLKEIKEN